MKIKLAVIGLIMFGIVLAVVGQFVGQGVETKHAYALSSTEATCSDTKSILSEACSCDGPAEIHWQENAGKHTKYIGSPFAVTTNAECFRAPDNRVAKALDTTILYTVPFAASAVLLYVLSKKWSIHV